MPSLAGHTLSSQSQRTPTPGGRDLPLALWVFSLATLCAATPLGPAGQALASLLPAWPCLFHELTGWPCPLCGLTRSFLCLGRLELAQALELNPAGAALFAFFCLQAALGWTGLVGRTRWRDRVCSPWPWVLLGAAFLASWAARLAGWAGGQ